MELIRDIKVLCAKKGIKLQDVTAEFYASLLADPGQPVNRLTACVCVGVCVCIKKESEEHTHTLGQPVDRLTADLRPQGQPLLPETGGGDLIEMPQRKSQVRVSRYDTRTRRQYAAVNRDGKQNLLGEGWIKTSGNGEWDESIEAWLTTTRKPDPKKCPDCGGTGFVTATLFDNKGAQKCTHPNLHGEEGK